MSKDDVPNPPAFPTHCLDDGMTLRDWFAGQALTSFNSVRPPSEDARKAYAIADAMLRARGVGVTATDGPRCAAKIGE